MINISLEVDFPALQDVLAEDFRSYPDMLGEWVMNKTHDTWTAGTDAYGIPWVPLAPSTLESRRRRNISGVAPLIATGRMLASMHLVKGDDYVELMISSPAAAHQDGTSRIPRRAILPHGEKVPDSWAKEIEGLIGDRVRVLLGKSYS